MKIILTGTSGFIGLEVLHQALSNPTITSIIVLSRRSLSITHPKLKTIILDDFTSYSPTVQQELSGAESCIWTLGVKRGDVALARKVSHTYTLAAAAAFSTLAAPHSKPFRFILGSGVLAVRDQSKPLWFMSQMRKIKGEAETVLLEHSAAHADTLDGYVLRPAAVTAKGGRWTTAVTTALPAAAVEVDVLAAAMLELALAGAEKKVWENADLAALGSGRLRMRG